MLGIVDSSSRSYALKAPTVAQVEIRLHVNGISEKKRKNMLAITARPSKRQHQAMETQTVPEYPNQLASQTQGLHDTPHGHSF